MTIRFFAPENDNKLADVLVELDAPWGKQSCRAVIVRSLMTGNPRVLWPKAGERFATTPTTREETAEAEKQILSAWKEWKR